MVTLFTSLLLSSVAFASAWLFPCKSSRSSHLAYGTYAAIATLSACLAIGGATHALLPALFFPVFYVAAIVATVFFIWRMKQLQRLNFRVRYGFEALLLTVFAMAATIAVVVTVGIFASMVIETIHFFEKISVIDFFFGLQWSPQIAIRSDQVGATGNFGFLPLLLGTLVISTIAMAVAVPMGFLSAAYLSEFANPIWRNRIKPILEILAGIPTIVYGFFALAILSPSLTELGRSLSIDIASDNALAAGLVMGFMLIPFVASLSEDALFAVPESLRQGALGLGSTRLEATWHVIVPAALPGIMAGLLLAFSRAIGETMIVVMAAGISAHLSVNPLTALTTITVQIMTLLTGDQTFDDAKTLAAFALGMTLFIVTLSFNIIALRIVRKYRQRYE